MLYQEGDALSLGIFFRKFVESPRKITEYVMQPRIKA